jgi:hypothetical protein
MGAHRLHHDRRGQHKDDLQQRPGRENLCKQRHVKLPAAVYGTGAWFSTSVWFLRTEPFRCFGVAPGNFTLQERKMKKISYVLAALATIAIAAPSIVSAEDKPMKKEGMEKPMMHHHHHHHHHMMKKMMKKDGM